MSALLELWKSSSALYGGNAAFIEDLYESYLLDPESVHPDWRKRFDQYHQEAMDEIAHSPIQNNFERLAREARPAKIVSESHLAPAAAQQQAAVLRLINAYRVRGHQIADVDPLNLRDKPQIVDLNPEFHKLTDVDMDSVFNTGSLYAPDRMKLRDIYSFVKEIYCGSIGSEYMFLTDTRQKRWIQKRLEGDKIQANITPEGKRWLLTLLTGAEGIEKYMHTRYVGQKRFSLEGSDALIPLMDELIQRGAASGIDEMLIGMAHRGRLNVLTNTLGKSPQEIFQEFEGNIERDARRSAGDVKYHMGFSTDIEAQGNMVHVALGFNPSHLEIINPVIEGSVRARQQRRHDLTGDKVLPILIHGDAAFAGQGVVMETMNLSQTRGYTTGGTVHVVINNQIGFTTSNPLDTRSTAYCTDIGKMVQAPIFHVNGDDPEAVIFVTRLALDYRIAFHTDVIIDLISYRRHGHNEADEPAVTQPEMYKKIRRHPPPRSVYADKLIAEGTVTPEEAQEMVEEYRTSIEQGRVVGRSVLCQLDKQYSVDWTPYHYVDWQHPADTGMDQKELTALAHRLLELPENFELHSRVAKIMSGRYKMANGDQLVDWGFAETLAYATLVDMGYPVRLSGEDCGRGTFFHRHAVLHNQENGDAYVPLQHVSDSQANFVVIDSILSEEAVLGYEYGYATAEPNALVLWEAQFGDFANGAQVVIDQFISAGGAKWGLHCGLVMLLPHGYEGQGAEHSSARIERYLQLSAEHNQQVCVPTTPAQIYHLIRRQMIRPMRKPLIVMTPKSLLRHRLATSSLDQLSDGAFQPVIGEIDELDPKEIKHIVVCSGKVYYDLLETRRARSQKDVAIIRIEQLYPFPREDFAKAIESYVDSAKMIVWCQEEPQNQGAWDLIKHRFHAQFEQGLSLYYVGRATAAAAATGSRPQHLHEQETLVDEALTGNINPTMNLRTPE